MNKIHLLLPVALCVPLTSCFKDLSGEIAEARKKVQTIDQEAADLRSRAELLRNKIRELKADAAKAAPAAETARKSVVRNEVKQLKATIAGFEPKLDGYKAAAATFLKQNP